ncbi:fibrinogen-like protein 1 [Drosophila grimshawi]|uniref:fibrinogen-like protein 1 n=1 Tax=Drosophila grimshawi TaxID=7222 RepID=UPI001C93532F|nr:fibrinogen-like protein 1 [Drosophila grimshawi]
MQKCFAVCVILCIILSGCGVSSHFETESTLTLEELKNEFHNYDKIITEKEDKLKKLEYEFDEDLINTNFKEAKTFILELENQITECQAQLNNQTAQNQEKILPAIRDLINNHIIKEHGQTQIQAEILIKNIIDGITKQNTVDQNKCDQRIAKQNDEINILKLDIQKLNNKKTKITDLQRLNRNLQNEKSQLEENLNAIKLQLNSKDERILKLEQNLSLINDNLKLQNDQKDSLPESCLNLKGLQLIKIPRSTISLNVSCEMNGNGGIIIQRRSNNKYDFFRDWNNYRRGFGDLNDDFFLGLENLHLITYSQQHELIVYVYDEWTNEWTFAQYDNFLIGNEGNNYTLESLGTYSGTASDGMRKSLNRKFSTHDKNNKYCANFLSGAWWYDYECRSSNLNGKPGKIYWNDWYSYSYSYSNVIMTIRPKNLNTIKNN